MHGKIKRRPPISNDRQAKKNSNLPEPEGGALAGDGKHGLMMPSLGRGAREQEQPSCDKVENESTKHGGDDHDGRGG
jgi:hypothetical protein